MSKQTRFIQDVTLDIQSCTSSRNNIEEVVIIVDDSENKILEGENRVFFGTDEVRRLLVGNQVPFTTLPTLEFSIAVLSEMLTDTDSQLQVDVAFGIKGQPYVDYQGNKKTYAETGVNVINKRIILSDEAKSIRREALKEARQEATEAQAKATASKPVKKASPTTFAKAVAFVDPSDDEEESEDDDAFASMDRTALKAYIKTNDIDLKVKQSMSDDDIRVALRTLAVVETEEEM